MIKNNATLLKIAIGFLTLFICQSCDPYTARRVPLGNSPYVNCKNCKRSTVKGVKQSKMEDNAYEYDFVGDEDQQKIQPLPIHKDVLHKEKHIRNSKKRVKHPTSIKKKSIHTHGKVKTQNLISTPKRRKKSAYIPLSKTPKKKYSIEKQRAMLAKKNLSIKNLSNRAKRVTSPKIKSRTLDMERAPAIPTKRGKSQLYDKLKELQKIEQKESQANSLRHPQPVAPVHPQPVAPVHPQPVAPVHPQPVAPVHPQPVAPVHPQPVAPVHPQPVAPVHPQPVARVHPQPVAPVHPQPVAPVHPQPVAPVHPQPIAPVHPQQVAPIHLQQAPPVHQQHQDTTKSKSGSPVAQYDLKNKPIPLLD